MSRISPSFYNLSFCTPLRKNKLNLELSQLQMCIKVNDSLYLQFCFSSFALFLKL